MKKKNIIVFIVIFLLLNACIKRPYPAINEKKIAYNAVPSEIRRVFELFTLNKNSVVNDVVEREFQGEIVSYLFDYQDSNKERFVICITKDGDVVSNDRYSLIKSGAP